MVRIVSGVQDEDPNAALLAGMQAGQGWRQAQQSRRDAEGQQLDRALRMQEIQMRFQKARAEREEQLNQAAQMGNAHAMQEQVLRRQLPESEAMSQDLLRVASKTTDPKAHAMLMESGGELVSMQKKKEETEAFQQGVAAALKDGIIDEVGAQNAQTRAQSGEPLQNILQEFHVTRQQNAEAAANMKENQGFLEQVQALAQSSQNPAARKKSETLIAAYEQSPSAQEKPGSGKELMLAVQAALSAERDEQVKNYATNQERLRKFVERFNELDPEKQEKARRAMQRFGPTDPDDVVGSSRKQGFAADSAGSQSPGAVPMTDAMQGHIASQRAEKEKRYPGSTGEKGAKPLAAFRDSGLGTKKGIRYSTEFESMPTVKIKNAKTNKDVIAAMRAAGVPITHETLAEAQNIRGSRAR